MKTATIVFSGGEVFFAVAVFSGGEVRFPHPREWAHPPMFDWDDTDQPPAGVLLPDSAEASPRHEPGSAAHRQL